MLGQMCCIQLCTLIKVSTEQMMTLAMFKGKGLRTGIFTANKTIVPPFYITLVGAKNPSFSTIAKKQICLYVDLAVLL